MSKTEALSAVSRPQLKTDLPGPNARQIIEADKRTISTSYTRDYPLVMSRG